MESFLTVQMVLAIGAAVFLFCIGMALVGWVVSRAEIDKRKADAVEQERRHKERLRALELGFPLPEAELARAEAEGKRAKAAGGIGITVPLGLGGLAVGATALILDHGTNLSPILYAVWGVVGLVSTITVVMSFLALRRGGTAPTPVRREQSVPSDSDRLVSSSV
jgi:Flp pilus assembly protein TadB